MDTTETRRTQRQVERTVARTIAFRVIEGAGEPYRQYVQVEGSVRRKGMYRNRRVVGYDQPKWSTDRSQARLFTSPAEAKRKLARELRYGIQLETVRATCLVTEYMWDGKVIRRYWGSFKQVSA